MLKENLYLDGQLNIKLIGPDGTVKDERNVHNIVVNNGLAYIAGRMVGTPTAMSHMGVGTSNTAGAATQTALLGETGTRESATATNVTTTVTNDTAQYVATFGPNNPATPQALTEAAIFDATTSGNMLCRTVFAQINKGVEDSLQITWKISLADDGV
jgi:hypothetical protein